MTPWKSVHRALDGLVGGPAATTPRSQGREIVSVFLCTGSHGWRSVNKSDATRIFKEGQSIIVELHNGGVVVLPVEHCGVEFGPMPEVSDEP